MSYFYYKRKYLSTKNYQIKCRKFCKNICFCFAHNFLSHSHQGSRRLGFSISKVIWACLGSRVWSDTRRTLSCAAVNSAGSRCASLRLASTFFLEIFSRKNPRLGVAPRRGEAKRSESLPLCVVQYVLLNSLGGWLKIAGRDTLHETRVASSYNNSHMFSLRNVFARRTKRRIPVSRARLVRRYSCYATKRLLLCLFVPFFRGIVFREEYRRKMEKRTEGRAANARRLGLSCPQFHWKRNFLGTVDGVHAKVLCYRAFCRSSIERDSLPRDSLILNDRDEFKALLFLGGVIITAA